MVWILRYIFFTLIILIFYMIIKYLFTPNRLLKHACVQKRFYMIDDIKNVRKNFLLTYKGAVFEGEKYVGTANNDFEVISILLFAKNSTNFNRLVNEDFQFIERKILEKYPSAKIKWKYPTIE